MLVKNSFSLSRSSKQIESALISGSTDDSPKKGSAGLDILNKCVEIDLLTLSPNQFFKFKHPLLLAYFAALPVMAAQPVYDEVAASPILTAALGFAASAQKDSSWVTALLENNTKDLLLRKPLMVAKWLKYTTKENSWRNDLLKMLINYIQDETLALPLRFRCFGAIISCNDPGLGWIFKKLIESKNHLTRHFGVLGIGCIDDKNNLPILQSTINDPSDIVRYASIISLGMLQDPSTPALLRELITTSHDESLRRIAAEVLAGMVTDGESELLELSSSSDILTRRAVVFGLEVLNSEAAREKLQDLSSSDPEWIIRATAARVLEYQNDSTYAIPRPLTAFASAEWLLKFAASKGEGVSPQVVPIDIFLQALTSSDTDLEWNALNYLRAYPEKEVIRALVKIYTNPTSASVGTIRSVDYNLWLYSASKN